MASHDDRVDLKAAARSQSRRQTVLLAAVLLIGSLAHAEEPAAAMFSLSGFGTLGVVHSSEELADFGASIFLPKGAGFTRQWSPEVDSRLGVQLTGNLSSRFSATLQLVSDQRHDGTYVPHVEWANIKYQLTPQLSVRVGRTALASFLVSDFRKVGYANPWVRPPLEVYGLMPVGNSDGVDASYTLQHGSFVHTLQGSYGETKVSLKSGGVTRGRDQWVVSDTIERGPATLRVAFQQVYVSNDGLHAVFEAFRQFGPPGIAIADRYDPNGKRVSFLAVGGMYDHETWFAMAEWGTADFRSSIGERTAWYTTVGYRIGSLTPYITYADTKANSSTTDPGLDVAGLPPSLAGRAAGLNAALNGLLGTNPVQDTMSVGARWDFMKNVDLKLQYNHIDLAAGSNGTLTNMQPGFVPGGTVNVFSATIDFVL